MLIFLPIVRGKISVATNSLLNSARTVLLQLLMSQWHVHNDILKALSFRYPITIPSLWILLKYSRTISENHNIQIGFFFITIFSSSVRTINICPQKILSKQLLNFTYIIFNHKVQINSYTAKKNDSSIRQF